MRASVAAERAAHVDDAGSVPVADRLVENEHGGDAEDDSDSDRLIEDEATQERGDNGGDAGDGPTCDRLVEGTRGETDGTGGDTGDVPIADRLVEKDTGDKANPAHGSNTRKSSTNTTTDIELPAASNIWLLDKLDIH